MDHEEDNEPDEPSQPPSSYVGYDSNDKNIFRVLSLNVQSMNNKFDAIRAIADSTGTSILAIQEVWGQNITTGYSIKGYHKPEIITRKTGGMNAGGGVAIWVKSSIDFQPIKVAYLEKTCEMQAILLPQPGFVIINVYRPFGDLDTFFETLEKTLEDITLSHPNCEIIMVGDFNIDLNKSSSAANRVIELGLYFDMVQQVTLPTRIQGSSQTIIDHVYVKAKQQAISNVTMTDISDHFATITHF